MKKHFIYLGLIVAAAFTLTNCAKEFENPSQQPDSAGIPFEITASTPDTKTANDGLNTVWVENDAINLFHAEAGSTTYVNDNDFTVAAADVDAGRFTGTLGEALEAGKSYDWYALYPYSNKIATPGAKTSGYTYIGYSSGLNQYGYNSMASLKGSVCPLYGIAEDVAAGQTPSVTMNHLSSVLAINVTNKNDEPLTISTASFTATEDIVGSYFIDITRTPIEYTPSGENYVKSTATVNVSGGTALAKGESAILYLAIKPFTAAAGKVLYLSVNGYQKELELPKDVTFSAGKIKTLNFGYDKKTVEVEGLSLPWYEDFSANDLSEYVITSSESTADSKSTTALYTSGDVLAGGNLPELLVAKNGGSLTATFNTDGFVGELTLSFKSNHADYITVAATSGVAVEKVVDNEYTLTVPENVASFSVTLKNSNGSNTRVDDIEIAKARLVQTLSFETEMYELEVNSADFNSFTGQTVSGNQTAVTYSSNNEEVALVDSNSGAVTLTGATGTAVITAVAEQTSEYKSAVAKYSIKVSNPSAVVTTKTVTYNFGTDPESDFSTWTTSYLSHTINYADATVTFASANKQSGTITDCPVTKGREVAIVMGDNRTLKSFELTLKKWGTKAQTVTLHYSKDGGSTYTETSTTSSNFALSAEVPDGTNAIKFTFSNTSNQVGVVSCKLTFDHAE